SGGRGEPSPRPGPLTWPDAAALVPGPAPSLASHFARCALPLTPARLHASYRLATLRQLRALGSSSGEQLPRVRPAELRVLQAGKHPGQLANPAVIVQLADTAVHYRAVAGLLHHQVRVCECGYLRQVSHDDDLGQPRQPGQPAADLDRRLAAHPSVDLVEYE